VFDIIASTVSSPVQKAEWWTLNVIGSQGAIFIEIRLTKGDATLDTKPIPLTDR